MSSDEHEVVRLPKRVEADSCAAAVVAALDADTRLLWHGGTIKTPVIAMSANRTARLVASPAAQLFREPVFGACR